MVSSRKQAHTAAAAHCQVLNGAPWSDPSARRSGIRRRMPDRGCRKGAVKCHQNWDTSMQPLLVESWVGEHWCADACLHKPTRSNLARGFCRVVTQRSDLTILHSSKRICELYSSGFKRWPWSPFPPRWRLFFILVGGGGVLEETSSILIGEVLWVGEAYLISFHNGWLFSRPCTAIILRWMVIVPQHSAV